MTFKHQPEVVSRFLERLPHVLTTPIHLPDLLSLVRRDAEATSDNQQSTPQVLSGKVERGISIPYAIEGKDFEIPPGTWICGIVTTGVRAKVRYSVGANARRIASSVIVSS